ncbi:MAG: LysM peptidoglycan-binding domain-containing protein [Anaerolineae bacterium]|nr:LysM peptidoglycan-binding domain-containing protein [Anaerolineae bacterium]
MNTKSLTRLISALLAGMLSLAMILGSSGAIQVDPDMIIKRPTRVSYIPTATLFPTSIPGTVTTVPPPASATPASPVIEQCAIPEGWVPWQVQEGDSIYTLAWRAGVTTYILLQANCRSALDLNTGDIIYLPPGALTTPTPEPYLCGPPPTWRIYYVQPGDTLFRLAVNYGTTIATIQEANCLRGTSIYVGQALYLPPNRIIMPTPTPLPITPGTPIITLTPTFTPLPPTFTPTPDTTGTPTLVPPTLAPTATGTLIPTLTPTFSPVPTLTPAITSTLTPTPGGTGSPTPTPTATGETVTPTPTPGTNTPTPGTGTPTPSPTLPTPTPTGTTPATPSATSTTGPTATPSTTAQPSPSTTPTPASPTPTLSPTPSISPTPS